MPPRVSNIECALLEIGGEDISLRHAMSAALIAIAQSGDDDRKLYASPECAKSGSILFRLTSEEVENAWLEFETALHQAARSGVLVFEGCRTFDIVGTADDPAGQAHGEVIHKSYFRMEDGLIRGFDLESNRIKVFSASLPAQVVGPLQERIADSFDPEHDVFIGFQEYTNVTVGRAAFVDLMKHHYRSLFDLSSDEAEKIIREEFERKGSLTQREGYELVRGRFLRNDASKIIRKVTGVHKPGPKGPRQPG